MRNLKPLSLLSLAAAALLLASCSGPALHAAVPDGFTSLQMSLAKSNASTQSITTQGLPYHPSDDGIAVDTVKIVVTDTNDQQMNFNYDSGTDTYTEASGGSTTFITLTQANQTTTVNLAAAGNPYTFTSYGKDASNNVIAYQQIMGDDVVSNATVMIHLRSLLSKAALVPRLPTHVVLPGSLVDLMLVVMPPNNTTFPSNYLQVPISDFSATYDQPTNANIAAYSDRGIRLQVQSTCTTNVTVTGHVTGLLAGYTTGSIAMSGTSGYSLPCSSTTGNVLSDLVPPTVSITSYTGHIVTGTADDNYGLATVQVYDGPVLLASSDLNEQNPGVVVPVTFTGGTTFTADLSSLPNAPAGGISAVAIDTSGNQSTQSTPDLNVVYVATTGSDGTGDGSQAHPFATIQHGVSAVSAGGTVIVEPGSYPENVTISKSLKLVSTGGSSNTTIASDPSGSEEGAVYVTGGVNDVQIGDVGLGFTIEGLNGNGASEKAAIYFKGNHDHITIKGNDVVANGDEGLLSEYGTTVTNFIISGNTFSGQTFTGTEPGGNGFGTQFDTGNNVPRQLVVIGSGSGGSGNPNNILFSDNDVTGTAGGTNGGGEQGNSLVTIDADYSTVSNNTFEGVTTRYGVSLRMRRFGANISGNTFDSSGLTPSTGQLDLENNALNASVINTNTFDRGVWVASSAGPETGVGLSIAAYAAAAPSGTTIHVLPGSYAEDVSIGTSGLTLLGANADVSAGATPGARGAESVVSGNIEISASNVTVNGFTVQNAGSTHSGDGFYIIPTATGLTISNNIVDGANSANAQRRGIETQTTNAGPVITGTVSDNELADFITGVFNNPGSALTITGNNIHDNIAGVGDDSSDGVTITNNTIADNTEGVGLGGAAVTVTGNDFSITVSSPTSYVTDYVIAYTLTDIQAANNFPGGSTIGTYGGSPAIVP